MRHDGFTPYSSEMMSRIAVNVVTFILLLPLAAQAYVRQTNLQGETVYWDPPRVEFWLDSKGAPGVGIDRTEAAVKRAFAAWNLCCSLFRFVYMGRIEGASTHFYTHQLEKNRNVVLWQATPPDYLKSQVGVTHFHVFDTGQMTDTDIELNGADFSWTDATPGPAEVSITSALVYYLGRAAGLDRTDYHDAVMSSKPVPGDESKLTLTSDEVRFACTTYSRPHDPSCPLSLPATQLTDGDATAPAPPVSAPTQHVSLRGGGLSCQQSREQLSAADFWLAMATAIILLVVLALWRVRRRMEHETGGAHG